MGNKNMNKAQKTKKDEFYTQLSDIEKELNNYKPQFKDKTVYCNCDTLESNFWRYFYHNYHELGLKGLIASHIDYGEGAYSYEYDGNKVSKKQLGSGDFRSNECIELLKQADIVCTNPPFSLFREYVSQLKGYKKQFLIIGNFNAVSYKEIFPLIKGDEICLGYTANKTIEFELAKDYGKWNRVENSIKYGKVPSITWFTNLYVEKVDQSIKLTKTYKGNEHLYPKYDNYNAIEVSKVTNIPKDYEGIMGVPITFLTKHNPNQFKILGTQRWSKSKELLDQYTGDVEPPENDKKTLINGKETYDRVFIIKKENENETI